MKKILSSISVAAFCALLAAFYSFNQPSSVSRIPTASVVKQELIIEIQAVGELEAARSISISSSIKGDLGKIIDLVGDGLTVKPGERLVKMDPSPFEEKVEKIEFQIKEQESYADSLLYDLEWEKVQAEDRIRSAELEVETAELEMEKMIYGDGPQEAFRLKSAMQKALAKYEELLSFTADLEKLETEGYLNQSEVKLAKKKVAEEEETYQNAKQQYDTYDQHINPMLIRKGEMALKKAEAFLEETKKSSSYSIAKAGALLEQARQHLDDLLLQLREAQNELSQTEIMTQAPGMVILREDYRLGERRKPRIGDTLVKNQPLIDLPDLSVMMMKTRIREVDLFKIEIGKRATITVDAYPSLSFEGSLSSVGVLAMSEGGRLNEEKYFEIKILLEGSDPRLRPGMTSRATIHVDKRDQLLVVPIHAIFEDSSRPCCYIENKGGVIEKKIIEIGLTNSQWAEVKKGLQEGDRICLLDPRE